MNNLGSLNPLRLIPVMRDPTLLGATRGDLLPAMKPRAKARGCSHLKLDCIYVFVVAEVNIRFG